MKCVCVEDKEYECIKATQCQLVEKYRFNCMTQMIDVIEVRQLKKEINVIPMTFTCKDSDIIIIELNPKISVVRMQKGKKILEVWV
jgi:hypothetical protein